MLLQGCAALSLCLIPLGGNSAPDAPHVENLRVASQWAIAPVSGDRLVYKVTEEAQGETDLNGDGDARDAVLHVRRLDSGDVTNLRLHAEDWSVAWGRVVFTVRESSQGNQDLNGDGDTEDDVLHIHELETGTTVNMQLAVGWFSNSSERIFALVDEAGQGHEDLNDDGDSRDEVLHILELDDGTTKNLRLTAERAHLTRDWLVFEVSESRQGSNDLNDDGDTDDNVLHVHDLESGETMNLRLSALRFSLSGARIILSLSEVEQGMRDLNGDGDPWDNVVHVYDLESHTLSNLRLAHWLAEDRWFQWSASGDRVAIPVYEEMQGRTVLNGDGDVRDEVIHVKDLEVSSATSIELAVPEGLFWLTGDWLVLAVSELCQGGQDLNGDGDARDYVLHVHDLEQQRTSNLRLAVCKGWSISWKKVYFRVCEDDQGAHDLNGDGDAADEVLHVHDLRSGTTTNLSVAPCSLSISEHWLAVDIRESAQGGEDLNGDGDAEDCVLHLIDEARGTRVNLGLAVSWFSLSKDWLVCKVRESSQGGTDLNGDHDAEDDVLHVVGLESSAPGFRRGDANADAAINITDACRILGFLFRGEEGLTCLDASDVDDTGHLSITDAIYLLDYLFRCCSAPPAPGPTECGPDPTSDSLGCLRYDPCP